MTSTLVANTVISQESENGRDVIRMTFLLPNCMAMPPRRPPKRAPSSDKLATQDACCGDTVKVDMLCLCSCWSSREAMAGEL